MNKFKIETAKKFTLIRQLEATKLEQRHTLSLKDLKKGSFIDIYGDTFFVEDVYTYTEKNDSWNEFKLVNVMTLEVRFMEIEEDDSIIVTLTEKEVPMRKLPDTDDIEEMADEEDGEIVVDGVTYYYDDDYKAKFSREGSDKKEKVYFYDFEADNGKMLTVEEWGNKEDGYSYEAFISSEIDGSLIEILAI